nr:NADPH-dependent F420 reductase [Marinicella sp. W31]MDC2876130.1 NADPH-dependent F420 reductase [Marinicella sp. W31]
MKIGIIGASRLGQSLARHLSGVGIELVIANSRGPETLAALTAELGSKVSAGTPDEAATCDMTIIAVPWTRVEELLESLPDWNGRILIDATNAFLSYAPNFELADLGGRASSEIVAEHAPGARVVKAFNTLDARLLSKNPREPGGRRVVFISGDDADAKGEVSSILAALGFAAIDLGGLADGGRIQQVGGPLAGLDLLKAG